MRIGFRVLVTLALRSWAVLGFVASVLAAASGPAVGVEPVPAAPVESYPGVVVQYDTVRDAKGQRLRLILTHPKAGGPRFATIFVVGWLSCDSVEAPPGTHD